MADDDPVFSERIRIMKSTPGWWFITTVGKAIDFVNDLPSATQDTPHWRQARGLLYEAYDPLGDAAKVTAAEAAFRCALQKERWLN